MKIGEVVESSIWLDGKETPEMRSRFAREAVEFLNEICDLGRVLHGPVRWNVLKPGDDRVPAVPDHIQGPNVRLLVAEADIVAGEPNVAASCRSFVGDLERSDLERLRQTTRRSHARSFGGRHLTDMECDDMIDSLGPEAAADAVRTAADGGTGH